MREQFTYLNFNIDEQQVLLHANLVLLDHLRKTIPLTSKQLFHVMRREWLLDASWESATFAKLIRKGLYAGQIDWNLTPTYPVLVSPAIPARRELWANAPGLEAWLQIALKRGIPTTTCFCYRRKWSPHHYYLGVDRLSAMLHQQDQGPVQLYYLADPNRFIDQAFDQWRNQLCGMIAIRVARSLFNAKRGQELWRPEGMASLPRKGRGSGIRNRVSEALKQAREQVEAGIQFIEVLTDLAPGERLSDQSPLRLNEILSVAYSGKVERVPNKPH